MAEPARKLEPDPGRPQPRAEREGRRGRVLPLRRRGGTQRPEDTWVLNRIVRWYRTRRD